MRPQPVSSDFRPAAISKPNAFVRQNMFEENKYQENCELEGARTLVHAVDEKCDFSDFERLIGTLERNDLWLVYRRSVALGTKLVIKESPPEV